MKKIFITLLLFCFYVNQAWGAMIIQQFTPAGGAGPTCTGSSTFAGGAIEEFEYGSGDFCNTDVTESDSDGILDTYDSSANLGDSGSYGMSATLSGTEYNSYIRFDLGAADSDFSVGFYHTLPSGDLPASNYLYFATLTDGTTPLSGVKVQVRLGYYSSVYKYRLYGSGSSTETTVTPKSTTYWITVDFNAGATSTLKVYELGNATPVGTMTDTANSGGARYIFLGVLDASGASPTFTQYFDRVIYDSDGGDIAEP